MQNLVKMSGFKDELNYEQSLRPSSFDDYIGQEKIKQNLKVFIKSAKLRNTSLDHILFCGPAGLGKTTLAQIIASQMQVNIKTIAAPMIEKSGDLAAILTNLEEFDILFIDEIHRLSPAIEEILYSAMEDFRLDIIIGQGPSAQTVNIDIAKFCLIAATTKDGDISTPLRDRFGINCKLNFYSQDELAKIISNASIKLNMPCKIDAAKEIAKRCRSTPRIGLRLLKRVRDFAIVNGESEINLKRTKEALNALGINELGFNESDIKYLDLLCKSKRPIGLNTLAAALCEDERTIEDVIEPFLIASNYIEKSARGRLATKKAMQVFAKNFEQNFRF